MAPTALEQQIQAEHVPARFWERTADGRAHCYLCPRHCKIPDGKQGFCFTRAVVDGELVLRGYGRPAAVQIDPIEKKPLSHYLPGTSILSLGGAGCNMGCKFCQNWDISKAKEVQRKTVILTPERVAEAAVEHDCSSVAYTYNEPTTWAEYAIDISAAARAKGLATVAVTNGYITPEAFHEFYAAIDAANVDLKGFTEQFYAKVTLTHLQPVLDCLVKLKNETDVWFEITTLLIPGNNDSADEVARLADWVLNNVGPDVPLHFTAFHPDYKMLDVTHTPASTLRRAREIATNAGCHYVYTGNVHDRDGATTYCPGCKAALVVRDWHSVLRMDVTPDGHCQHCGQNIPGRWS